MNCEINRLRRKASLVSSYDMRRPRGEDWERKKKRDRLYRIRIKRRSMTLVSVGPVVSKSPTDLKKT
jgi:hypothetical protein